MDEPPIAPPGTPPPRFDGDASLQSASMNKSGDPASDENPCRVTLDTSAAVTIATLPWKDGRPGKCYQNVKQFVIDRGGSFATGWARADCGPIATDGRGAKPLYDRWIHHIVWEDLDHGLWEVTPYFGIHKHEDIAWAPTSFILDREAVLQIGAGGVCWMLPARYVAAGDEGGRVAECLNRLERDGSQYETYWLQQAVQALQQTGFAAVEWHVERIDGRINNVWLFANFGQERAGR